MFYAKPGILTSVKVSPEFYKLCKNHGIKFSEAMRVGISVILAERGIEDYDNSLNIVRLLTEYKKKAGMYAQKLADLENKKNKLDE